MSLWNKSTKLPTNLTREEKRNVVVTDQGFVLRSYYKDVSGVQRTKDQILVPLHQAANSTNFGTVSVTDVWHDRSAAPAGTVVRTSVSFSEPITSTSQTKITISGANTMRAVANTTPELGQNTLVYKWKPTVVGTYSIGAQSIANNATAALNIRSTNLGTETATVTISAYRAAVANTVVVS